MKTDPRKNQSLPAKRKEGRPNQTQQGSGTQAEVVWDEADWRAFDYALRQLACSLRKLKKSGG